MTCPVCELEMIVVEREGIEVDYCISCRGIWFDAGEVDLLAEKLGCTLSVESVGIGHRRAERSRPCPRCRRPMDKVDMDGTRLVTIDRCPDGHGMFFDAGEAGALLELRRSEPGLSTPIVSFLGEVFGGGRT